MLIAITNRNHWLERVQAALEKIITKANEADKRYETGRRSARWWRPALLTMRPAPQYSYPGIEYHQAIRKLREMQIVLSYGYENAGAIQLEGSDLRVLHAVENDDYGQIKGFHRE